MTDAKTTTPGATTDAPKTDAPKVDTPKTTKAVVRKYYKVLSNRVKGVWYKDPSPYVLLTAEEAKGFGKIYVEQKAHDKVPEVKKAKE